MKPAQIAQLAFIALAALAVYMFVSAAQDGEARAACTPLCALSPAYANQDRLAPDFELPDMSGKPVRLSSYRGKTIVLNFWTKTCRPCLEEMPSLTDLAELLRAEGAELVTITSDPSAEDARQTLHAVLNRDPNFTVLIDPDAQIINGKFGTKLFPETWIIDPDGIIRARVDGARDWTNPVVLNAVRMFSRKSGCGISFEQGKPRGDHRGLCSDTAGQSAE